MTRRARRAVATGPDTLAEGTGPAAVAFQLAIQDGVITRSQLAELGVGDAQRQRMLRRKELVRVAPGVFVTHTGELTWIERAWVAVLACWPAALAGESVWSETDVIEVWSTRSVSAPRGVRVRKSAHAASRTNWMLSPPRQLVEHAALDVAGRAADEHAAVGVLTDRIQSRATSAARLAAALGTRERTPRGRWLARVLADLAEGTNSVLELEYLLRVERAHGLPVARRQHRGVAGDRTVERDAEYVAHRVVVELDGRTHHEGARARDRDLDRDLAAAAESGLTTVRLGWGQVLKRPCSTARRLEALLRRGGWTGTFVRCPHCP